MSSAQAWIVSSGGVGSNPTSDRDLFFIGIVS